MKVLTYSEMYHNAVRFYLEQEWGRKLDDHEKHLAAKVHDYVRTSMEAEEVRIIDDTIVNIKR